MRNREDERACKDTRAGFNQPAKELEAGLDKVSRERF
jgi:hypothetical protein